MFAMILIISSMAGVLGLYAFGCLVEYLRNKT